MNLISHCAQLRLDYTVPIAEKNFNSPDHTEEVDVGVVDGEINQDCSRASVDPEILVKRLYQSRRLVQCQGQILGEPPTAVCGHVTGVAGTFQLRFGMECPTVES